MQIQVTDKEVIIRLPRINPPSLTKSGKSLMVATTSGIVTSTESVDGKPLHVGINIFVDK